MQFLAKCYFIVNAQFGVDPRKMLRSIRGLPRYLLDLFRFRSLHTGRIRLLPCLHDWYEEGGATKTEYFWQDLIVARMIFEAKPEKHVDIGSRVDGFVAHVASFREIEVFDVRSISTAVPGVVFRQADLMPLASLPIGAVGGYCDSLSCLHAIEHFGLGRYGDPINPQGYERGITNMAHLLRPGGTFYLSTPIGEERVEFNAHWVFDPRSIVRCAEASGMLLQKLTVITPLHGPQDTVTDLAALTLVSYQLGLFVFTKARS